MVITIDTNSRFDQPASRGSQLLAALDYLTQRSSVRTRIDPTRLAVAGHSMGGGGSLEAASDRPSLQAAIPLQPWNTDKTWSEIRDADADHRGAERHHRLGDVALGAVLQLHPGARPRRRTWSCNGASHFVSNSSNTPTARQMIAWLKRYVDNDTRYEQFICPPPSGTAISEYRNTCPG